MPDQSNIEALQQSLICQNLSNAARDWLLEIEVFKTIGSTNDRIAERISGGILQNLGDSRGIAATTEFQSAGKGRRGKKWQGQSGLDIALSQSCYVSSPAVAAEGLSLVVGLAVISAIQQFEVAGLSLKWPNDILLGGKKLGGILIELVQQQEDCFAVIGVGLNMGGFADKQNSVLQPVADLSAHNILRNSLVSMMISHIHDFCCNYMSSGFEPFRKSWNKLHYYQGRLVELKSVSDSIRGRVVGVGLHGELILEDNTGKSSTYYAGELSLRPQA